MMANIAVIYWSGTGNTQSMAELVAQGIQAAGAQATVLNVSEADDSVLDQYDAFALGCPAMGDEELEEMEFEPFMQSIESGLSGKKIALFGSYGWGDGQWMQDWAARMTAAGAILTAEPLIVSDSPVGGDVDNCRDLGEQLARFV